MAIVEVVSYNGNPDVFAWKYPNSEMGTWTQLIVNESQEAILVKGGQICDIFQAGRHTLNTANIPILNKIINIPFGDRSPFVAEVWYINKVFSLDIKWGTPTPIQLQDPKYKVFVPVRAFGQFGIQIKDSQKFLVKLVVNLPQFDKNNILKYFRGVYLTKVKDLISSYLIHKNVSILEVNAYLDEISNFLKEKIAPTFDEYGIELTSFNVNDINIPEDDYAVKQLKQALSKKAEMDIVGYSYQQERSFDTLEGAVTNPNSMQGGLMGAGIGLGMGVGIGGSIGSQFTTLTKDISVQDTKICPKCSASIDKEARFCSICGFDTEEKSKEEKLEVVEEKNEIRCSSCGATLEETSKFCTECGKKYNPCVNCKSDIPDGQNECPTCKTPIPTICPICKNTLPPKGKFCPECGYSMVLKCSKCGIELNENAKFCADCGTPVK